MDYVHSSMRTRVRNYFEAGFSREKTVLYIGERYRDAVEDEFERARLVKIKDKLKEASDHV